MSIWSLCTRNHSQISSSPPGTNNVANNSSSSSRSLPEPSLSKVEHSSLLPLTEVMLQQTLPVELSLFFASLRKSLSAVHYCSFAGCVRPKIYMHRRLKIMLCTGEKKVGCSKIYHRLPSFRALVARSTTFLSFITKTRSSPWLYYRESLHGRVPISR